MKKRKSSGANRRKKNNLQETREGVLVLRQETRD
jgi:hypothetical protein